jgi:hypothetical protein
MNAWLPNRMAVIVGLALAAAAAVWWLASARLALDRGTDGARFAADALDALLVVRVMALAVSTPRVAALLGWRPAWVTGLGMIGPSWPVVLLAWSASTAPTSRVVLGELLLLAAAFALPVIGSGLRRWLARPAPAVSAATAVGIALATVASLGYGSWIRAVS